MTKKLKAAIESLKELSIDFEAREHKLREEYFNHHKADTLTDERATKLWDESNHLNKAIKAIADVIEETKDDRLDKLEDDIELMKDRLSTLDLRTESLKKT